jgi:hypothetical protein
MDLFSSGAGLFVLLMLAFYCLGRLGRALCLVIMCFEGFSVDRLHVLTHVHTSFAPPQQRQALVVATTM